MFAHFGRIPTHLAHFRSPPLQLNLQLNETKVLLTGTDWTLIGHKYAHVLHTLPSGHTVQSHGL
jgi:hypothetical protein